MSSSRKAISKICVVTSYSAMSEPRAPRHALAVARAFPEAEVFFVDMATSVDKNTLSKSFNDSRINLITLPVYTRKGNVFCWLYRRIVVAVAKLIYLVFGKILSPVFGSKAVGLTKALTRIGADLYIAHTIDSLLPAASAANKLGAKLVFDCMEFYSDMGAGQTALESRATKEIEAQILPRCSLILASSEVLAAELEKSYKIKRPLALYNTPDVLVKLPSKVKCDALKLYWRNSVIGFGQRGLDDALCALTMLPLDVILTLQGKLPEDGGVALRSRINELSLVGRVFILPPYIPGQAVSEASAHNVGLCMERRGPRNHDYTVSNKLFDYMMAGLAVIVPDLAGLTTVVNHAGSGLIYKAGSPSSLAEEISILYRDRDLLRQLSGASRKFALIEGNNDFEMKKFQRSVSECIDFA